MITSQWRPSKKDYQAYGLQIIACSLWVVSFIYPSQQKMYFVETALIRGLTCCFCNYFTARFILKNKLLFDNYQCNKYFVFMNLRSLCLGVYALFMPLTMFYLPMPAVHTIAASAIVVVSILDYFIYKVIINKIGIIGIFLGLFGVLIMANDSLIIQILDPAFQFTSEFKNYYQISIKEKIIISLLLFGVICLFSFSIVTTKSLKHLSPCELNFHNSVYTIIGSSLLYPFIENKSQIKTLFYAVFLVGVPVFASQWMFYLSIQLASKTGVVMTLNTFNILVGYLVSIFRYHEKVHVVSIIGALLIVTACSLILLFKV